MLAPIDLAQAASRARLPIALAIGAIFAALAALGSGPPGSGTRINLGPIQPIELVKPLAIAFLAAYLGGRAPELRWHRRRLLGLRWPRLDLLVPAIGVLLAIVAGLYVIGDLGPVLLLALVFLGMFFVVSRATGWVVVAFGILALALTVLALWPALAGGGTVQTRLVMWQDPWTNGMSNGHQLGEGLWAINAAWMPSKFTHSNFPIDGPGRNEYTRCIFDFHQKGIFVNSIEYPAVPKSQQRFRISIMATHTKEDIDRLMEVISEIWRNNKPEQTEIVHVKTNKVLVN